MSLESLPKEQREKAQEAFDVNSRNVKSPQALPFKVELPREELLAPRSDDSSHIANKIVNKEKKSAGETKKIRVLKRGEPLPVSFLPLTVGNNTSSFLEETFETEKNVDDYSYDSLSERYIPPDLRSQYQSLKSDPDCSDIEYQISDYHSFTPTYPFTSNSYSDPTPENISHTTPPYQQDRMQNPWPDLPGALPPPRRSPPPPPNRTYARETESSHISLASRIWSLFSNPSRLVFSRTIRVVAQLVLTTVIFLGLTLDFTFNAMKHAILSTFLVLGWVQNAIWLFNDFGKFEKRRLRRPFGRVPTLIAYLQGYDLEALRGASRGPHENPLLPGNITLEKKLISAHASRKRAITLLRHRVDAATLEKEKNTFRITFTPKDISGGRYYLKARVCGILTECLIDTGSMATVISESYLEHLNSCLGVPLTRLANEHRLVGVAVDTPVENRGTVSLDFSFTSQEGHTLHLDSVPTYVASSQFQVLLGQNIINRLDICLDYNGPTAFVNFKRVPNFGTLSATLMDNEFVHLELEESAAIKIEPKIWTPIRLALPHAHKISRCSFDNQRVLLETPNYDDNLNFSEVSTIRKAKLTVNVMAKENEPVLLVPHRTIFVASLLQKHDPMEVTKLAQCLGLTSLCNPRELELCHCELEKFTSVAFASTHHGYTYLGPTPLTLRKDCHQDTGIFKVGEHFFFVPDKFKDFSLMRGDFISDFLKKYKEQLKGNSLTIVACEPLMVTQSLMALIAEMRKYIHIDIRYSNLAKLCNECRFQTLSSLSIFPAITFVRELNIVIPSANGFDTDVNTHQVFFKQKSHPILTFSLQEYKVNFYLSSPYMATVFIHLFEIRAANEDYVYNILNLVLSQIKRVWPYATLSVFSNILDECSTFENTLARSLKHSRSFPGYESGFPEKTERRKKTDLDTEITNLSISSCSCTYCSTKLGLLRNGQNKVPLRQVYSGPWPTYSESELEKFVADFEKLDEEAKTLIKVASMSVGEEKRDIPYSIAKDSLLSAKKTQDLPDELLAVNDAFATGHNIFTSINSNLYSALPIPRTCHEGVRLSDLDKFYNFATLCDSRLVAPLRLLLWCFRDTLRIHETDFGHCRSFLSRLRVKPEFRGKRIFSKGYNLSERLYPVLEEIVAQYCQLGLWERNRRISVSSPVFVVLRSSSYKANKKKEGQENGSVSEATSSQGSNQITHPNQLENPTKSDIRLVTDCTKLNEILEDEYSNYSIRSLTAYDIAAHLHNSTFTTQTDCSLAFNSCIIRSSKDRELLGMQVARMNPFRSVTLAMGIKTAPVLYFMSMRSVLEQDPMVVRSTLNFFDDFLTVSPPKQREEEEETPPPCEKIEDAGRNNFVKYEGKNCTCHVPYCKGCIPIPISQSEEVKQEYFDNKRFRINSIPPNRMDIMKDLFSKFDPLGLLPQEYIIETYNTFPINKGVLHETCLQEEMPSYPTTTDDEFDAKEAKEHLLHVAHFLQGIRRTCTKLTLKKSKFLSSKDTIFYGHAFDRHHIKIVEDKKPFLQKFVKNVRTVKDIQKFLGSVLNLSLHINGLAHLSRPLYNILSLPPTTEIKPLDKKIVKVIIDKIITAPPLKIIPSNVNLVLVSDASAIAVGITLGWTCKSGKFNIGGYYSIALPPTLCASLSAIEKELYGYASFLLSSPSWVQREKPTIIVTDARSLWRLSTMDELPAHGRLYKILNMLRALPIQLRFRWRPGTDKRIKISDALSRIRHYSYFMPGSLSRPKIETQLKEKYTDDISHLILPEGVADKDWDIINLEALKNMFNSGFFPVHKNQKDETASEFIANICSLATPDCSGGPPLGETVMKGFLSDLYTTLATRETKTPTICAKKGNPAVKQILAASTSNADMFNNPAGKVQDRLISVWRKSYLDFEAIQKDQHDDAVLGPILKEMLSPAPKLSKRAQKKYVLLPSLLLARRSDSNANHKIVLPEASAILLLAQVHVFAHNNAKQMVTILKRHFFVPNISHYAALVERSCLVCLLNKTSTARRYSPGRQEVGFSPYDHLTMDHVTLFPSSEGPRETYSHALGIKDTFSKMSFYLPLKTLTATETIKVLTGFFSSHAIPRKISTDNGPCFISKEYEAFLAKNNISHSLHTPNTAWSHSTESENRLFVRIATFFLTIFKTRQWTALLPQINMALRSLPREYRLADENNVISTVTMTPYKFLHGLESPYTLDDTLRQAFPSGPIPHAVLKERNEVLKLHQAAVRLELTRFAELDDTEFKKACNLQVHDFVVLRDTPRRKYHPNSLSQIYTVVAIKKRQVTVRPVFSDRLKLSHVHIAHVKKVELASSIFKGLSPSLKAHLGGSIRLPAKDSTQKKLPLPAGLRQTWPKPKATPPRRSPRHASNSRPEPTAPSQKAVSSMGAVPGFDYVFDGESGPLQNAKIVPTITALLANSDSTDTTSGSSLPPFGSPMRHSTPYQANQRYHQFLSRMRDLFKSPSSSPSTASSGSERSSQQGPSVQSPSSHMTFATPRQFIRGQQTENLDYSTNPPLPRWQPSHTVPLRSPIHPPFHPRHVSFGSHPYSPNAQFRFSSPIPRAPVFPQQRLPFRPSPQSSPQGLPSPAPRRSGRERQPRQNPDFQYY